MVQETSVQTGGMSAEYASTGAAVNMIPKSGSNTFRTILNGLYSNHSMESDNLTDDLRALRPWGRRRFQRYEERHAYFEEIVRERLS